MVLQEEKLGYRERHSFLLVTTKNMEPRNMNSRVNFVKFCDEIPGPAWASVSRALQSKSVSDEILEEGDVEGVAHLHLAFHDSDLNVG
jgi:hypothetical protein